MTNNKISYKSFSNTRMAAIHLVLLYRIILDYYYYTIVSQEWAYMGLSLSISIIKLAVSYLITVLIYSLIAWERKSVATYILEIMYIVMIIPMLSFYGMANKSTTFICACSIGFCLTVAIGQYKEYKQINTHISIINMPQHSEWIGVAFLLIVLLYQLLVFGFFPSVIDFVSPYVYEVRAAISGKGTDSFFAYFITWSYKTVCPFMLAVFLYKKKTFMVAAVLCIQLLLYMSNPHKEILFSSVLVIVLYYSIKKMDLAKMFLTGIITVLIIDIVFYGTQLEIYSSTIIRRLLFVPAEIKNEHFDFFSQIGKLYFSEGKLGRILNTHYPFGSQSTGEVIAYYFHGNYSNSNTGYLAYSYDNLGLVGIMLASIVVGLIIMYFQRIAKYEHAAFIAPTVIYYFIQLNDIPVQTTLLTGGMGLLILILFVINCANPPHSCCD